MLSQLSFIVASLIHYFILAVTTFVVVTLLIWLLYFLSAFNITQAAKLLALRSAGQVTIKTLSMVDNSSVAKSANHIFKRLRIKKAPDQIQIKVPTRHFGQLFAKGDVINEIEKRLKSNAFQTELNRIYPDWTFTSAQRTNRYYIITGIPIA